jgi:hypothetical protein
VTLSVQEAEAAKDVPQPVAGNSVLLLDTVIACVAVVLFLMVKVLAVLTVPWATEPNEREVGVIVIGSTPFPVRVAARGPPIPLKLMLSEPVCAPAVVGAKVVLIVQFAPPASELPQVVVSAKGAAVEILKDCMAAVPAFLRVKVYAALVVPSATEPKLCAVVFKVMGDVPVPESVIVWLAGVALSLMTTLPVAAPSAVGLKVMLMAQFLPAATDVPQVLVCANGALATMLVTLSAVVLVFDRVTR